MTDTKLTFDAVRRANLSRTTKWHPGGLDEWSATDWACAMAGEAGEVCNEVKKLRRIEGAIASNDDRGQAEIVEAIGRDRKSVV